MRRWPLRRLHAASRSLVPDILTLAKGSVGTPHRSVIRDCGRHTRDPRDAAAPRGGPVPALPLATIAVIEREH